MSHKVPFPPPGFDELSIEEKVEYAGDLWDYVTSDPDQVPTPDWHMEIIEERLGRDNSGGNEGISLEDFEKKLEQELNRT